MKLIQLFLSLNKILLVIVLLPSFFLNSTAQKRDNYWYYADQAAIDFSSGSPVALSNSAMDADVTCGTMSDTAGNLLFYTNGAEVFNRNHNTMSNGSGLNGSTFSSQGSLIVPLPGNNDLYYIFTIDDNGSGPSAYSIVDMTLAAGMGAVTTKNSIMLASNVTTKVTAAKNSNGTDYWVIEHLLNSNSFYVYPLTATGLGAPVISNVGTVNISNDNYGNITSSPEGDKIASSLNNENSFELYDFDNSTGIVSNPLNLGINFPNAYGICFSPDGTKLYGSSESNGTITQWDLSSDIAATIVSSATSVGTMGGSYTGAIQWAPDHKLYVINENSNHLGVINHPDSLGSACNFVANGFNIGSGASEMGLPQFIPEGKGAFTFKYICFGDSTEFKLTSSNGLLGAQWDFGDTASGVDNYSTFFDPVHVFTSPGTYTVEVIKYYLSKTDTIIKEVNIHTLPIVNLGPDTTFCSGWLYLINTAGIHHSYTWQNNSPNSTYTATVAGNYFVTVEDSGCYAADTIVLGTVPCNLPVVNLYSSDSTFCGNKCINFHDLSSYNPTSWQWLFPGAVTTSSTLQNPTNICYNNAGSFYVTLIACNIYGCDTIHLPNFITEYAPPTVSISQTGGSLYATAAFSYQWWNVTTGIIAGATGSYYTPSTVGGYYVVVTDSLGCSAISNIITVNAVAPAVNLMSSDTTFCEKQCIDFYDLSTNNPTSWQWFFPGADTTSSTAQYPQNICYNTYGSFDVTLIACNAIGCDTLTYHNFIIEYQTPLPTITQSNDTLFSSPGIAYQWWNVSGGMIAGATNNYFIPTQAGDYYVMVTDSVGCEGASNTITITGINEEARGKGQIAIVPNPNDGSFTVALNDAASKDFSLRIINTIGQTIYKKQEAKGNGQKAIEVKMSNIAKGLYAVEVINGGKVYRGRFIVK